MTTPFTYRIQGNSRLSRAPWGGRLETLTPRWTTPNWLDEEMDFISYSAVVPYSDISQLPMPLPESENDCFLDQMMERIDTPQIESAPITLQRRSKPFAQGITRLAYYARSSGSEENKVAKVYFERGLTLPHSVEDMLAQVLCKAFAVEFDSLVPETYALDFALPVCLERANGATTTASQSQSNTQAATYSPYSSQMNTDPTTTSTPGLPKAKMAKCMFLEPWIEGPYVKYNSNGGWVNRDLESSSTNSVYQAAQAFSHYTFERSRGKLLVTDLQGVGRVLTDPAVQTIDHQYLRLSRTNLGRDGYCLFFLSHECNRVCKLLGLQSDRDMLYSGVYMFREVWPYEYEPSYAEKSDEKARQAVPKMQTGEEEPKKADLPRSRPVPLKYPDALTACKPEPCMAIPSFLAAA